MIGVHAAPHEQTRTTQVGASITSKEWQQMGYGFGGFLIVVGLVLAFAVNDALDDVNLYAVGLIMAGVGVVIVALTAFTLNNQRRSRTVQTTTHPDGSQPVNERRNEI